MVVSYDPAFHFTQGGEKLISRALAGAALAAALVVPSTAAAAAPLAVSGLTADRQANPLGLGDARPSFSWRLDGDGRGREQSAYQVIVSKDGADVWDSGEVHSPASANVPYGGPALQSATRYTWKVRAWDEASQPSAYSAPASLETGLLTQRDLTAKWIGAPASRTSPGPGYVLYHFARLPAGTLKIGSHDASADTQAEVLVNIKEKMPLVEHVRLKSTKGFRMMLVAAITSILIDQRYRMLPDGHAVPSQAISDMSGSMLGKAGRMQADAAYSDFKAVR